ncbi:hypothetical protein L211DRAFT_330936 [Terfezia boudieri ATCC MYA-4762]|uniref:MAP kinase kinase kinase n=1 Tax=Terfezia boudieri ATCC MYA-4762 TaxID=1051890 RepID=A0A3N4LLF5_9PEZI|nr:hypothetical protein L211DRAFT_330936 [Terfezia boudieri ATCC MYA-4762]
MMPGRNVRFHDHDATSKPEEYHNSLDGSLSLHTLIDNDSGSGSDDSGHSPNGRLDLSVSQSGFEDDYGDDDLQGDGSPGLDMAEVVYSGSWNAIRPRTNSIGGFPASFDPTATHSSEPGMSRPQRPSLPARAPSNTYAPQRHPPVIQNISQLAQSRTRSTSANRARRDPIAQYRAQEKAYVQRLRQDNSNDSYFNRDNPLVYGDSDNEDESPSELHPDSDLYETDTFLLYGQDDMDPSAEEMKIPENRERLEWHSMLSNVLKGDVVKQEKKRMIGSSAETEAQALQTEIWVGIRAKVCGRSIAAQRRVMEDGQAMVDAVIDEIINFKIAGREITEKIPRLQVRELIQRWEKCEALFPHRGAMADAKPKVISDAFIESWDAIVSWHNVTEMISTELAILQSWVGNYELDFGKPAKVEQSQANLSDDSSFLDRILKEDGLKSLVGDRNMLKGIGAVVGKAKKTLIENHDAFKTRHLPPYIQEMLLLINFPTRLIEEIIRIRLKYAKKIRSDPAAVIVDQLIQQFQAILRLAVQIKQEYTSISRPERGWDLPACMDENFEHVVLEGLKFYFRLLNWKLSGNKNTFKEAEILGDEWHFSNSIGRYIDGGDVQVAEEFSSLTAKLLLRLASQFERELERVHPEENGVEVSKRYKQIMDSVRIRQRKLFRFTRLLSQRFENSTEFNVDNDRLRDLVASLITTGHFLVYTATVEHEGVYLVADPSLLDRPQQINQIMRTCYHDDSTRDEPSCPYVLIICPQSQLIWDGRVVPVDMREPIIDIKPGRVRLVADGSQDRLATARDLFHSSTNHGLDIIIEQRANLPRVNWELFRIKRTTYRLSNTIMDSVNTIRRQTDGLDCQELIQSCFAFATEFGQRSVLFMDNSRRAMNNLKLIRLAVDWVSFICDDCVASDRKTFKWAVVALEFAMGMTRGQNILSINREDYKVLQSKVAGCMSLLIGHFDILGARSTIAAQAERQRMEAIAGQLKKMDVSKMMDDEESLKYVQEEWTRQLREIDEARRNKEFNRQGIGRVLDDSDQTDRSLTTLSSSFSSVALRWQQGQFLGGGSFGSVYAAMNLDSGMIMAVKEIRLQDPQYIPQIASAIREEMTVLEQMDHPNIVQYFGIEVHRDRVYLFMEYCSGGSLAGLLEHGRVEDETVIMIYTLQMLEGLGYLHEAGIVHRDIKPENILLDHNGIIKYVDFGAAKVIAKQGKTKVATAAPSKVKGNSMTGTPMYMSPEVITGSSVGRRGSIDIWSLGCVVLEMATGRRPWANLDNEWAIMWNIASGHSPQLPTSDQLSPQGIDFLEKCFTRDPKLRPSAAELLQHEWVSLTLRKSYPEFAQP